MSTKKSIDAEIAEAIDAYLATDIGKRRSEGIDIFNSLPDHERTQEKFIEIFMLDEMDITDLGSATEETKQGRE